jgi:hypothetical protein
MKEVNKMEYVCRDCKYQDICGDMDRTQPCDGYCPDDYEEEFDLLDDFCELDFVGNCGNCRKCDMWVNC